MANLKLGYVGKCFTFGAVGIVATLVACGGGGVTNTVAQSTTTTTTPSPYILFASSFLGKAGATGNPWVVSGEGGDVFSFEGGGFNYTWGLQNDNDRNERQAVGNQYNHAAAITSSGYFGFSFKAPANGTVNASQSGTLVISMGNGALGANPNGAGVFVIDVQGGTQNPTDYSWSNSCSFDQTLASTGNSYGLRTYRIPLSSFTCTSGTLAALKANIKQVSVKVVGGKEPTKDVSTTNNDTLMQVSYIGFSL